MNSFNSWLSPALPFVGAGPGAAGIRIKKFYYLIFYKGMLFLLKYL